MTIEGPRFSTKAESHLFRSWGCDIINMTTIPEVTLAREAGICYTTIAMSTDYDCWHQENEDVSVEAILKVLNENADRSRSLVSHLLENDFPQCASGCSELMKTAVITPKEAWPPQRRETLEVILS